LTDAGNHSYKFRGLLKTIKAENSGVFPLTLSITQNGVETKGNSPYAQFTSISANDDLYIKLSSGNQINLLNSLVVNGWNNTSLVDLTLTTNCLNPSPEIAFTDTNIPTQVFGIVATGECYSVNPSSFSS